MDEREPEDLRWTLMVPAAPPAAPTTAASVVVGGSCWKPPETSRDGRRERRPRKKLQVQQGLLDSLAEVLSPHDAPSRFLQEVLAGQTQEEA